jgi:hypothetical protein
LIDILRRWLFNNETGQGKWVVIPAEAGTGKSIQTDKEIGQYIRDGGQRRYLIVKRFVEDVYKSVERINSYGSIYDMPIAKGIDADNWRDIKRNLNTLTDYPVVVITHDRYERLCGDQNLWNVFAEDRDSLVVDEALQPDVYYFNEAYYNEIMGQTSHIIHPLLFGATRGLFKVIERLRPHGRETIGNRLITVRPQSTKGIDKAIHELTTYLKANARAMDGETLEELRRFVNTLYVLYRYTCIYSGGTLYSFNRNFGYFTLRNNIVLDANGTFDAMYKLNPNIEVEYMPRTVDHSRWTIHHIMHGSSAAKIRRTPKYWDEICRMMKQYQGPDKKVLAVCHKEFEDTLRAKMDEYKINADIAHYGAIIGKNDWRNHNQVWLLGTPYPPMALYPIYHSVATRQEPDDIIQMVPVSGGLAFTDHKYNLIMHSHLLGELYQSTKRINRDNAQSADVFVVTGDRRLVEALAEQMSGAKLADNITINTTERPRLDRHTKADELAEWLVTHRGIHSKRDVCAAVGIRDTQNLSRLLKHDAVQRLYKAGKVKFHNKSIEVV